MIFLNIIDGFTPKHMQVLNFFTNRNPMTFQTLLSERDLTDQVVIDLNTRGLIKDPRTYTARGRETSDALVAVVWEVSSLGKQFLDFVKAPTVEKS
jgi:hypothetical protein